MCMQDLMIGLGTRMVEHRFPSLTFPAVARVAPNPLRAWFQVLCWGDACVFYLDDTPGFPHHFGFVVQASATGRDRMDIRTHGLVVTRGITIHLLGGASHITVIEGVMDRAIYDTINRDLDKTMKR